MAERVPAAGRLFDVVSPGWRAVWTNAAVGVAYGFCAWLVDLFFAAFGLFPAPIWPSAGIALVAMMVGGMRQWPGVFLGSLLANYYLFEPPLWAAAAISVSNTLGPWLGAVLIGRAGADRPLFSSFYHAFVFVLYGIVVHSLVVATSGALVVSVLNDWPVEQGFSSFIRWMLADASGALFVAPVALLWMRSPGEPRRPIDSEAVTAAVVTLVVVAVSLLFFFGLEGGAADGVEALPYLLVAPLIWSAVRFPLREAYNMVALLALIATTGTVVGLGPFNAPGVANPLIALGLMVVTLALTVLAVGAVTNERRRYARQLAEVNEELEHRVEERTRGLQQAALEAGEANRAKSRFLAAMGHEVRTPLTTIVGTAELLREGTPEREARKLVEILSASSAHLLGLVDKVLDFACLDETSVVLQRESFDPRALVREAVEIARPAIGDKAIELWLEMDELPARVVGDGVRLRQVMVNLIGNAIKYTERGTVTVRVGMLESSEDRCPLHFEVEDTGPGIPAAERERIFRSFERLEERLGNEGAGLGLAICKRLVDSMDGVIDVDSVPGQGSLFWFVVDLPVSADESAAEPTRAIPGPYDMLVAEDSEQNREIIRRLLARDGHRVVAVGDGEAAVATAREGRFDCILLDVQMPGIGGMEAARRIRALPGAAADTPILALTASATGEVAAGCKAAGMDGVLVKPLRCGDLYETLQHLRAGGAGRGAVPAPDEGVLVDEALLAEYRTAFSAGELEELVSRYRRALETDEAALREAWAARDLAAVGRTAHKLSGSAAAVGFSALSRTAYALEQAALATDEQRVRGLLERFGVVRQESFAALAVGPTGRP